MLGPISLGLGYPIREYAILAVAVYLKNQIRSNKLVKHEGTGGRRKPCNIKIEGAWKSRKGKDNTMLSPGVA